MASALSDGSLGADGYMNQPALTGLQEDLSKDFEVTVVGGTVTFNTTADVPNQVYTVISLCPIPKGARVLEWFLDIPAAVGTAKFELGDTADADRYAASDVIDASAAGFFGSGAGDGVHGAVPTAPPTAAQLVTGDNVAGIDYIQDDILILTCTTNSSTVTGTPVIRGWLRYNMRGQVF